MVNRPFSVQPQGAKKLHKGNHAGPRPLALLRPESEKSITPLARGLEILSSFSSEVILQNNKQIALHTGLPVPTVSRLLKSLVSLGYLHYNKGERKYRLAASVLGLGYAAVKENQISWAVHEELKKLAESTDTYVTLCTQDRLNLVVVDSHLGSHALLALDMTPGTRLSIAGALAGAAFLTALPEQERAYFFEQLELKGGTEWPAQWRRIQEKISQVHKLGFCMSPGEWVPELSSISVPIQFSRNPPWVLSCTGRAFSMPRSRLESEMGPKLVIVARRLKECINQDHPKIAATCTESTPVPG